MSKEYSYGVAPYTIINGYYYVLLNKALDNNLYNFFKGKLENTESTKETAIREFYEETGVLVDINDLGEYFYQNSKRKNVGIYLLDWSKYKDKKFHFQKSEIWSASWVHIESAEVSNNQKKIVKYIQQYFNKKGEYESTENSTIY